MKGHITDKGNGKYQLVVTIGSDYRGKPRRFYKTVTAKSDNDVQTALAVFYHDCEKNRIAVASSVTFQEFVSIWEREYAQTQLKKSTYISNMRLLNRNFEMFNKKKLNQIKPFHVRQWITFLSIEKKHSPKTVRNNYSLLRSILHKAVQWEYIDKNPAENIELPKPKQHEAAFYNADEVVELIDILASIPKKHINYVVAILLGLFGGLRRGEICGIDVNDVNLNDGTIRIKQTRMVYGQGGLYIDSPKTLRSTRTITLPKGIMQKIEELLQYQEEQKMKLSDIWQDSPALLKNETGNPIYPQSVYRWFSKLQKEYDLPHLPLHGLRHTHVSMLVDCDMNLEDISKRLGHSQKTTTLNIYSHLFSDKDEVLAMKLEERFLKK